MNLSFYCRKSDGSISHFVICVLFGFKCKLFKQENKSTWKQCGNSKIITNQDIS